VSGSPAFRHDLIEALAEKLAPKPRPDQQQPVTHRVPAHRTPKTVIKAIARPWVSRYLEPRITRQVQLTFDQLRSTHESSNDAQSMRIDSLEVNADSLEVNAEMLKAQLHAVNHNLERLTASVNAMGMAIAPTAGIDGVPGRLAELRERLNAVERRTRPAGPVERPGEATKRAGTGRKGAQGAVASSPIDYVGFERRFRGDPADVGDVTRDRYLELLRDHGPVLDVGCGKGELVEALVGAGVAAVGIDLDAAMVDEAHAKGLDVHVADLNTFLEHQPPQSFGSIISTQVVEHLQIGDLVRFLELSVSRLQPGGLFIAETPNPASLIVLGTHFILDPTHVRPIHPALMVYLCECAGFRSVELKFFEPATQYHLEMVDEDDAPLWTKPLNANFTRINDVLFGPQDYAVVARTPI
jgi:2-polyprenyl-3-methyl-5-hydroxy-6-metoxy-1,4-benzoquinol methylase